MTEPKQTPPIADRVRLAREQLGLSQPELAERVGMSQQGVAAIESGRSKRPTRLRELARVLKRSEDWLMGGDEEAPSEVDEPSSANPNASSPPRYQAFGGRRLPLLGQAQGGSNGRFVLNGQEIELVFCPPMLDGVAGAYAVYVYGDSMEPKFEAGETVWLHPYLPVRRGDYVVAQIAEGNEADGLSGYIKQFVSRTGTTLTLRQLNPGEGEGELLTFDDAKVFSIHKIVFHALV